MARRFLYRGRVSIRAARLINSFPMLLPFYYVDGCTDGGWSSGKIVKSIASYSGPTSWILLEPRNLHPRDTRFLFEREVKSSLSRVLNQSFHRIVFPRHFHRAYFLLQRFPLFFFHAFSPSKYIQHFISNGLKTHGFRWYRHTWFKNLSNRKWNCWSQISIPNFYSLNFRKLESGREKIRFRFIWYRKRQVFFPCVLARVQSEIAG